MMRGAEESVQQFYILMQQFLKEYQTLKLDIDKLKQEANPGVIGWVVGKLGLPVASPDSSTPLLGASHQASFAKLHSWLIPELGANLQIASSAAERWIAYFNNQQALHNKINGELGKEFNELQAAFKVDISEQKAELEGIQLAHAGFYNAIRFFISKQPELIQFRDELITSKERLKETIGQAKKTFDVLAVKRGDKQALLTLLTNMPSIEFLVSLYPALTFKKVTSVFQKDVLLRQMKRLGENTDKSWLDTTKKKIVVSHQAAEKLNDLIAKYSEVTAGQRKQVGTDLATMLSLVDISGYHRRIKEAVDTDNIDGQASLAVKQIFQELIDNVLLQIEKAKEIKDKEKSLRAQIERQRDEMRQEQRKMLLPSIAWVEESLDSYQNFLARLGEIEKSVEESSHAHVKNLLNRFKQVISETSYQLVAQQGKRSERKILSEAKVFLEQLKRNFSEEVEKIKEINQEAKQTAQMLFGAADAIDLLIKENNGLLGIAENLQESKIRKKEADFESKAIAVSASLDARWDAKNWLNIFLAEIGPATIPVQLTTLINMVSLMHGKFSFFKSHSAIRAEGPDQYKKLVENYNRLLGIGQEISRIAHGLLEMEAKMLFDYHEGKKTLLTFQADAVEKRLTSFIGEELKRLQAEEKKLLMEWTAEKPLIRRELYEALHPGEDATDLLIAINELIGEVSREKEIACAWSRECIDVLVQSEEKPLVVSHLKGEEKTFLSIRQIDQYWIQAIDLFIEDFEKFNVEEQARQDATDEIEQWSVDLEEKKELLEEVVKCHKGFLLVADKAILAREQYDKKEIKWLRRLSMMEEATELLLESNQEAIKLIKKIESQVLDCLGLIRHPDKFRRELAKAKLEDILHPLGDDWLMLTSRMETVINYLFKIDKEKAVKKSDTSIRMLSDNVGEVKPLLIKEAFAVEYVEISKDQRKKRVRLEEALKHAKDTILQFEDECIRSSVRNIELKRALDRFIEEKKREIEEDEKATIGKMSAKNINFDNEQTKLIARLSAHKEKVLTYHRRLIEHEKNIVTFYSDFYGKFSAIDAKEVKRALTAVLKKLPPNQDIVVISTMSRLDSQVELPGAIEERIRRLISQPSLVLDTLSDMNDEQSRWLTEAGDELKNKSATIDKEFIKDALKDALWDEAGNTAQDKKRSLEALFERIQDELSQQQTVYGGSLDAFKEIIGDESELATLRKNHEEVLSDIDFIQAEIIKLKKAQSETIKWLEENIKFMCESDQRVEMSEAVTGLTALRDEFVLNEEVARRESMALTALFQSLDDQASALQMFSVDKPNLEIMDKEADELLQSESDQLEQVWQEARKKWMSVLEQNEIVTYQSMWNTERDLCYRNMFDILNQFEDAFTTLLQFPSVSEDLPTSKEVFTNLMLSVAYPAKSKEAKAKEKLASGYTESFPFQIDELIVAQSEKLGKLYSQYMEVLRKKSEQSYDLISRTKESIDKNKIGSSIIEDKEKRLLLVDSIKSYEEMLQAWLERLQKISLTKHDFLLDDVLQSERFKLAKKWFESHVTILLDEYDQWSQRAAMLAKMETVLANLQAKKQSFEHRIQLSELKMKLREKSAEVRTAYHFIGTIRSRALQRLEDIIAWKKKQQAFVAEKEAFQAGYCRRVNGLIFDRLYRMFLYDSECQQIVDKLECHANAHKKADTKAAILQFVDRLQKCRTLGELMELIRQPLVSGQLDEHTKLRKTIGGGLTKTGELIHDLQVALNALLTDQAKCFIGEAAIMNEFVFLEQQCGDLTFVDDVSRTVELTPYNPQWQLACQLKRMDVMRDVTVIQDTFPRAQDNLLREKLIACAMAIRTDDKQQSMDCRTRFVAAFIYQRLRKHLESCVTERQTVVQELWKKLSAILVSDEDEITKVHSVVAAIKATYELVQQSKDGQPGFFGDGSRLGAALRAFMQSEDMKQYVDANDIMAAKREFFRSMNR